MNRHQIESLQWLTNSITRSEMYSDGHAYLNGPVVFTVEERNNTLWFYASNNTSEKRWFETYAHAIAIIGPQGGIDLRHCEGFGKHCFGMKYNAAARRSRRAARKARNS